MDMVRELAPLLTWKAVGQLTAQSVLPAFWRERREVILTGLRHLASLPSDRWTTEDGAELVRRLAALSGIAEPQRVTHIQGIVLTTFCTFAEILREPTPVSDPQVAGLVSVFGQGFGTRDEDVTAIAEVITRTAAGFGVAHYEPGSEEVLELVTDTVPPSSLMIRSSFEAWARQHEAEHGPFDVLMDEETGLLEVNGEARTIPPLQWRLLSCVLRYQGRALPNSTVGEELWGDELAESSKIDEAYHLLITSIPLLNEKRCIVTQRGCNVRMILPTLRYCLVLSSREVEPTEAKL